MNEKYIIYTNDVDLQTAALAILLNSRQIAEATKNTKLIANVHRYVVGIEISFNEQSKRVDIFYLQTVQEALALDKK